MTKLNTITSSVCGRLETCKMLYLALVGIAHQLRSMWYCGFITIFITINSPSTLNRNGRISKSKLHHTSQQLSQHDYPIRIFSHKHKCMYMEQTLCRFLSWRCYEHVTFGILSEVWFINLHGGGTTFVLHFNLFNFKF